MKHLYVCLTLAATLAVSVLPLGCSNTTASEISNKFDKLAEAMEPPQLGGSSRIDEIGGERWEVTSDGIPQRLGGRACLHGVNFVRRARTFMRRARRHFCILGTLINDGAIPEPGDTFAYYKLSLTTARNRPPIDLRMRAKKGLSNFCVGTSPQAEISVTDSTDSKLIKVTDSFLLPGAASAGVHQASVTVASAFKSGTFTSFGGTFRDLVNVTAETATGGYSEVKAVREKPGVFTHKIYAQFKPQLEVCAKFTNGTDTVTTNCSNNSSADCATTTPACATPVADFVFTGAEFTPPTVAPSYVDKWEDCTAATGGTFVEISVRKADVLKALRQCHRDHGGEAATDREDTITEDEADSGSACS